MFKFVYLSFKRKVHACKKKVVNSSDPSLNGKSEREGFEPSVQKTCTTD